MKFGCIPSTYDSRDYKLKASVSTAEVPEEYCCPQRTDIKNQQQVSSCVAHAVSSILEYHATPKVLLSTNFIYGIKKELFNDKGEGMMLRDACKIAANYGDMLLEDCSGNNEVPECFAIAEEAFKNSSKIKRASTYRILKYFLCLSNKEIKQAIYNYGPVLAAIKWYDSFKVDKTTGVLSGEQKGSFGFHAVMIDGYTKDGFWCQNSWGARWGKNGRFFLPNSVKILEARGFVDWNGYDDLKEPAIGGFWNLLYKGLNAVVNLVRQLLNI